MRMSRMAGRASGMSRRARVIMLLSVFATAAGCGALLLIPGNVGAAAVAQGVSSAAPSQSVTTNSTGQAFGGVPEVGALFTESAGALGTHFCTASVVHSTHGDLAVTAAHCLASVQGQQVVFVPGYANGKEPYGAWTVTAVDTDEAWQSSQNPDDDVAFLRLADSSKGVPIEHVTGAERLGTTPATSTLVRVRRNRARGDPQTAPSAGGRTDRKSALFPGQGDYGTLSRTQQRRHHHRSSNTFGYKCRVWTPGHRGPRRMDGERHR